MIFRMIEPSLLQQCKELFNLSQEHSLSVCRSHREVRNGMQCDVQWLEEYNAQDDLIARSRLWTHAARKPPYKKQNGWEKFSIDGQLLDKEVRYSQRQSNEWLH